jgi:hypothetical protein
LWNSHSNYQAGPAPHAAALHCADCGAHRQWIARSDYAAIREFAVEIAARFGDLGAISFRGAIQHQDNQEATEMQKKAAFDNTNRGVLFKNKDKTDDKHADYQGNANVNGEEFWLNAWIKTSKKGTKYMSLSLKPKQEAAENPKPEFNDEISF